MPNENMFNALLTLQSFLGLIFTGFFAFGVSCVMKKLIKEGEFFTAPQGISQTHWTEIFKTPEVQKKYNRLLGYLEALLSFVAFSTGRLELIGGWLAFKLASKWETWSTIWRLPVTLENTSQLEYIRAKKEIASHTLQRWLLGTLLNVLAGAAGILFSILTLKLQLRGNGMITKLPISIDENTYRYLFSTVAQSMAALFAIGGVFAVFRLQAINQEVTRVCTAFKNFVLTFAPPSRPAEVNEWLNKDVFYHLLSRFESIIRQQIEDLYPAFVDYYKALDEQLRFRDLVKAKLSGPTALVALLFILSTSGLILLDNISHIFLFGYALSILILSIITIIFLILYIRLSLNGPKDQLYNNPLVNEDAQRRIERARRVVTDEVIPRIQAEREAIQRRLRK